MVTFDKKFAPDVICPKDEGRYFFNGVHVDPKAGRMVATDGRILLAVIPCKAADDAEHLPIIVPASIIKAARTSKMYDDASVGINGTCSAQSKDGTVTDEPIEGSFPDVSAVLLDARQTLATGSRMLGINADLLAKLAKALGSSDGVVWLELPAPDDKGATASAMHVTTDRRAAGSALPAAFGLIMPVVD